MLMAFIPTPDVARCAIKYRLFGQDVINTLWFRKTSLGPLDGIAMATLGTAVATWSDGNLLPLLSEDLFLVSVTATSQESATAPSVETIFAGQGSITNPSLPGNVCITVKFNTAFRGRSGRGRNYVGGLYETSVVGNTLGTPLAEDLIAAYNLLISSGPAGYDWVVVSHFTDHAPRDEGFVQGVIACTIPDFGIDSQRRRLTGRGS